MIMDLPADVLRSLLSFVDVPQLVKLVQTQKESQRHVRRYVEASCNMLCPPKKRVRRTLRGLAYLNSESGGEEMVSAAKSLLQQQTWQKIAPKLLSKIPSGSLLVVDLSGSKRTLDAVFVEQSARKGGGSTVSIISKQHRPLLALRLDSCVLAVLTPRQQDALEVPHHQYLDLIGRIGRVSWNTETRRPMRWVEDLMEYRASKSKEYVVQINRVFANVLRGVEDVQNPFVQAHFLDEDTQVIFHEGSRVQTRYNGVTWWHGTITEMSAHDTQIDKQRCRIEYDDGSFEVRLLFISRCALLLLRLSAGRYFTRPRYPA
jgi:hypothetical protein